MGYIENVQRGFRALIHPSEESNVDFDVRDALVFYYELAIIPIVLFIIFSLATAQFNTLNNGSYYYSDPTPLLEVAFLPTLIGEDLSVFVYAMASGGTSALVPGLILLLVILPLGMLLDALAYQLVGKFFLNVWKGNYSRTFTASVFGGLPLLLFYWFVPVPTLSWIALFVFRLWGFVLLVISLATQQKVERFKTFVVLLLVYVFLLLPYLSLFSLGVFNGGGII